MNTYPGDCREAGNGYNKAGQVRDIGHLSGFIILSLQCQILNLKRYQEIFFMKKYCIKNIYVILYIITRIPSVDKSILKRVCPCQLTVRMNF